MSRCLAPATLLPLLPLIDCFALSLVTYPCHNDVVPSGCTVRQQHNRTTGRTWNSSKAAVFYSSNLCFLSFEKLKTSTAANSFLIVNNACLLFPQQWEPANTHIHKLTHREREREIWTYMQRGSAYQPFRSIVLGPTLFLLQPYGCHTLPSYILCPIGMTGQTGPSCHRVRWE